MSSTTNAPADPASEGKGAMATKATGYSYFVAIALMVVYTLNFLDRQFLSVLAQPVKNELHLTDTELGALTGLAFALFYTICGIPIAALADRYNRVRIVAISAGVWSLFTAACGFATSFLTLAIPRVGVGVGEAGGSPPSYSVVSDYFPPEKRGLGLAIYSLGVPFGSMIGTMSGGFIAAAFGWRVAFWTLGIIGLCIAPIIPFIVKEPKRGGYDPLVEAHEPKPSMFASIAFFVKSPVLMLTAVAAGLTAFVGYGMLNWIPSFLIREKGMKLTEVALYYAIMSGLCMAAGTFLSGLIVDKLGKKSPAAYALVPGLCILASVPFLWGAANVQGWPLALICLAGPSLLNNTYLAPALAVVQNGVPPRNRGTSGALLLFILNLIGLGGGPFFVGIMSDYFKPQYGEHALTYALLALTPFFILAFLCQLAAGFMLRRQGLRALAA